MDADELDRRACRVAEETLGRRPERQPDCGAAWRRHAERRDRQGPPSEPVGKGEAVIERAATAEGETEPAAPAGGTRLHRRQHGAEGARPSGAAPAAAAGAGRGSGGADQHEHLADGAQRPDVQMALSAIRAPTASTSAATATSTACPIANITPASPISRSTTAAASATGGVLRALRFVAPGKWEQCWRAGRGQKTAKSVWLSLSPFARTANSISGAPPVPSGS